MESIRSPWTPFILFQVCSKSFRVHGVHLSFSKVRLFLLQVHGVHMIIHGFHESVWSPMDYPGDWKVHDSICLTPISRIPMSRYRIAYQILSKHCHLLFKNCWQILKLEERSVIALIIRRGIEVLDAMAEPSDAQLITESDSEQFQRITVGSPLPPTTLAEIERNHRDDIAWTGLRKKIGKAFTGYLSRRIAFNSNDEVLVQLITCQLILMNSCQRSRCINI